MNKQMEDAFRFLSAELKENPSADKAALIEKAAQQFDLNPMQAEFLLNKYLESK